jgi:hypothetical protein
MVAHAGVATVLDFIVAAHDLAAEWILTLHGSQVEKLFLSIKPCNLNCIL